MLVQLSIKNFALIDDLLLDFSEGLNVLTGETGAGKSILIDALQLVLGERFDSRFFRYPDRSCILQAVFQISRKKLDDTVLVYLNEEDDCLIVRREISPDGRSRNTINGQLVNLSELKRVGRYFVDIHGQYDQQMLFERPLHLKMVDLFAGFATDRSAMEVMNTYQSLFEQYKKLIDQKNEYLKIKESKVREIDLLSYQVKEIEAVKPQAGEDEELEHERIRLASVEKLSLLTTRILEALSEGEQNASGFVSSAVKDLHEWLRIDGEAQSFLQLLQQAQINLEESIRDISAYRDGLEFNDARLDEIQARLDSMKTLKKKYGGSVENVLNFYEDAKQKLDYLMNSEVYEKDVENQIQSLLPKLKRAADEISKMRKRAMDKLCTAVEKELRDLAIRHAKFLCRHERCDFAINGNDSIEFLFSSNAGEEPKPLVLIASGGEAARVMLAIKKAFEEADPVGTLIFDEIDANIGGRLGDVVGQKVQSIASRRQVILITHLPQIASFAKHHIKVIKTMSAKKTSIQCEILSREARIQELAHMMSGSKQSDISKAHAQEMLESAKGSR